MFSESSLVVARQGFFEDCDFLSPQGPEFSQVTYYCYRVGEVKSVLDGE